MNDFERITQETQTLVDSLPPEIPREWHRYKELRSRPVGTIVFKGMGLYEGFTHHLMRGLEIDDE